MITKNSQPLVSIVIPTYNRAHLINQTLDSVLTQTYVNWECIVVDDGSTDTTEELLHKYIAKDSRFRYYKRPDNYTNGGNGSRNYGYVLSKGDFINWFDDDDIMLPDFLTEKVKLFDSKTNLVICTGDFWNPKTNSKIKKNLKGTTNLYQDFLCWRIKILTPSVLFRKAFFKDKELFSSHIHRGQEGEFYLRIFYKLPDASFKIINKSLFLYRQHENNKTTKDSNYQPKFNEGRYFIYYSNFIRLKETGEKEGINFCYHQILNSFYLSINNSHHKLSKTIMKEFFPFLKQQSHLKFMELVFFGRIFILINKSSYKLISRWKTFNF